MITANFTFFKSFLTASSLNDEAPTPTGSRITGMLTSFAFLPARMLDFITLLLSVPMLITKLLEKEAICATSFLSSAIKGAAPTLKIALATSFTVT